MRRGREKRYGNDPTAAAIAPLSPVQNQNSRKEVGRCAPSSTSPFHDHPVCESNTAFLIILGLENAALNGINAPFRFDPIPHKHPRKQNPAG
jgi:hypothetical protein